MAPEAGARVAVAAAELFETRGQLSVNNERESQTNAADPVAVSPEETAEVMAELAELTADEAEEAADEARGEVLREETIRLYSSLRRVGLTWPRRRWKHRSWQGPTKRTRQRRRLHQ